MRCTCTCVLAVLVALGLFANLSEGRVGPAGHALPYHDWLCTPDDQVPLDVEELWRLQRLSTDSPAFHDRNQRLLSFLGVPFTVSMLSNGLSERDCLIRFASFFDRDHGICPPYVSATAAPTVEHTSAPDALRLQFWQFYYYVFDVNGLDRHFGVGRLQLLRRLRLPREWDLVEQSRLSPDDSSRLFEADVRQAAAAVARTGVSTPPGLLQFTLGSRVVAVTWDIALIDVNITLRPEAVVTPGVLPPVTRTVLLASMSVDLSGIEKRLHILNGLVSQRQYAKSVESFDERVRTVRDSRSYAALLRVVKEEVDRLSFEMRQAADWKAHVREARGRREAQLAATNVSRSLTDAGASLVEATRSGMCEHVQRAWRTLQQEPLSAQGGREALLKDTRFHTLLHLARLHRCATQQRALELVLSRDENDVPSTPAYCAVVCDAVRRQRAWSTATAVPPTVAQNMALLTAAFVYTTSAATATQPLPSEDHNMTTALEAALAATDEFDALAFLEFATHEFQATRCVGSPETASVCLIPRRLVAEMEYTQAMLALLQTPQPRVNATTTTTLAANTPPATASLRPVARVQQSAWLGSTRATAALATMKEHGLWLRQQNKVAAATLLRSMFGLPNSLHVTLLKARLSADRAPVLAPRQLLRFERVFAMANSWSSVDKPFVTAETVKLMVAMEDVTNEDEGDVDSAQNPYDEARGAHGLITARIGSMLLRALFHLTGFKDVRRSTETAECLALTSLRMLGYTCDMELRESLGIPILHAGMCEEYKTAVLSYQVNYDYPRVRCTSTPPPAAVTNSSRPTAVSLDADDELAFAFRDDVSHRSAGGGRRAIVVPPHEIHYQHLQGALLYLSYHYLVTGQQYSLAAVYTHLAFRAASHVHAATLHQANREVKRASVRAALQLLVKGYPQAEQKLKSLVKWNVAKLFDRALVNTNVKHGDGLKVPAQQKLKLPSFADSPFLTGDHWTLLGLVGVPARHRADQSRHEFMSATPVESAKRNHGHARTTSAVTQRLVRSTLAHLVKEHNNYTASAVATPRSALLTSLSCFLKGATLWSVDAKVANILDHTIYAVHRSDPFVLAATMVEALKDSAVLTTTEAANGAVRHDTVTAALRAHVEDTHLLALLGDTNYLPLQNEADKSFAVRLLMQARTHVRRVEVTNVMTANGMVPRALTEASAVLNDAPTHAQHLSALRISKQYAMEEAEFQPLLLASDLQSYQDTTSRPVHVRLFDRLRNSVYYLFTETVEEAMARRLGASVLDDADTTDTQSTLNSTRRTATRVRTSAPFVSLFQDCFLLFPSVRQLTVALLLFTFSVEQGLPQGFALLFLEAADRSNPFLQPVAHYLSTEVWTPAVVRSMFLDHQAVAQWHHEKRSVRSKRGTLHSLDRSTPFSYSQAENRQELMARLAVWQATRELLPRLPERSALTSSPETQQRLLVPVTESLTMCASPLLHHLYVSSGRNLSAALSTPNVHRLFDGMLFPASAAECILALMKVATTYHQVRDLTPLITLLQDLGDKRAVYYGLALSGSDQPDFLPPSAVELGDGGSNGARGRRSSVTKSDADDTDASPAKLVEPWSAVDDDGGTRRTVGWGEGYFYNQRLHDVSGTRTTAVVLAWKEKLLHFLPFLREKL